MYTYSLFHKSKRWRHALSPKNWLSQYCSGHNDPFIYPLPKRKNLDSSKLKGFADDNFKPGENGRKFSKRVENTVEKGEIARSGKGY